MKNSSGIKYMVLSTLSFSFMNIVIKWLSHIPSHELVFFRAIISLFLCIYSIRKAKISPWGKNKPVLILRGLFGTIALLLYFYTVQEIPLATAITLQHLSPIFTIILAHFLLKEHTSFSQWFFVLLSFFGVWIMKGAGEGLSLEMLIIGVSGALLSGLAYNMVRKLKTSDHPMVVIFYFPLVTLPLIGPYTLTHFVMPVGFYDWGGILLIGIFTQLGQVYLTKAYQMGDISKVSNTTYFGIVYAVFWGWLLFDEIISLDEFIGMLLIVSAVVLSSKYKGK